MIRIYHITILFICIVVTSTRLGAQPWQNICQQGVTFYLNGTTLNGIRFDSTVPSANQDTLFTSFLSWRSYQGIGWRPLSGSLFGKQVQKRMDGTFIFFERFPTDTIYRVELRTTAQSGEQWLMYTSRWQENLKVYALVTTITSDTILGIVDSIKVITLQARDTLGNNIPSVVNGQEIRLGKVMGLVKTRDFGAFLADVSYELAGKPSPPAGLSEISGEKIFDFQPGDVFHYTGSRDEASGPNITQYTWQEIQEIITREVISGSYRYLIKRCVKEFHTQPSIDTVIFTEEKYVDYSFNSYHGTVYSRLPGEVATSVNAGATVSYYDFSRSTAMNGRHSKSLVNCGSYCNQYGCFYGVGTGCYVDDIAMAEGIGITYSSLFSGYDDNHRAPGPYSTSTSLVYYRKGPEVWGTPVATDCNMLIGFDCDDRISVHEVTIFPTPVRSVATIRVNSQITGTTSEFLLYNLMGNPVLSFKLNNHNTLFHRSGLPSGLYVWKIIAGKQVLTGKVLLE